MTWPGASSGASVIHCCYAAKASPSSTMSQTVDCPNLTFSYNQRSIADRKNFLKVNRRVVNPACITGVLTSAPKFKTL
jgi:hypothetical protein